VQHGLAIQQYVAAVRTTQAGECVQQCGLATAVGAQNCPVLPALKGYGQIAQQQPIADAQRKVAGLEARHG